MAPDALSRQDPGKVLDQQYLSLRRLLAPGAGAFKAAVADAAKGGRPTLEALYDRTAATLLPNVPLSMDETLGQAKLVSYRQQNVAVPSDSPQVRRVQAMIDRLAGDHPLFPYKVTLFENDGMEAASIGGSAIIMTTGMLDSLDTDAKLAGVLAHELNHGEQRDVVTLAIWDELTLLDKGRRPGPKAAAVVDSLGRGVESKADAGGARRAVAAGYPPGGMLDWLLTVRTPAERRQQALKAKLHPDDHPTDAQRIADLRAQIATEHLAGPDVHLGN